MDRREFLRAALVTTTGFCALGSGFWRALASHTIPLPGPGPYGPLGPPDANGIRLPAGFSSRVLARGGEIVPGTDHRWHVAPDGGATFATPDGGWILVSNSEVATRGGGAGAMRFDAAGNPIDAYRILDGTQTNCAGGATPWGTWLSCEEHAMGLVWECDPTGINQAVARPAMGAFKHEAAVVDPLTSQVYLTEDVSDGRFYRFTPDLATPSVPVPFPSPILRSGTLAAAKVEADGAVSWLEVPFPIPPAVPILEIETLPTRRQVPDSTPFARGEGAWFDTQSRTVYFCATTRNEIWAYHVDEQRMELLYSGATTPGNPLNGADNITTTSSGDILVCEDGGQLEIVIISREATIGPLLQVTGSPHAGSELAGVCFDPSGTRLYFSSQRAYTLGVTYEITGPFRTG